MLATVFAQSENISLLPEAQFSNLGDITLNTLVRSLIIMVLIVAAMVFFFMLIWGGIKYITSGGDKAQTEAARGQITSALIGLVVVFSAWAIINLVEMFFGVDLLELVIPNAQNVT